MIDSQLDGHQRINDILFGKIERRLLAWFCIRMPVWVTPDMLTFVAFVAGIIIAVSYALTNVSPVFVWLASLGLIIHWFGDSLDGSLARHRKIERPRYGFFIDHSTDTLVEVMIALGIGLSAYVRLDCVLFALSAYLMMSVLVSNTTCITGVFQISYCKFGPTELRILIIIANTIFYFVENPVIFNFYGPMKVCDIIAIGIGVALMIVYIFTALKTALALRRNEDSFKI
jgi:phosphatidylglycerophosphate synthase